MIFCSIYAFQKWLVSCSCKMFSPTCQHRLNLIKKMASMHHSISCYALIIHHLHGKITLCQKKYRDGRNYFLSEMIISNHCKYTWHFNNCILVLKFIIDFKSFEKLSPLFFKLVLSLENAEKNSLGN